MQKYFNNITNILIIKYLNDRTRSITHKKIKATHATLNTEKLKVFSIKKKRRTDVHSQVSFNILIRIY